MRETEAHFLCRSMKASPGKVLMEKELTGFPLLVFDDVYPESLILAENDDAYIVMARFSDNRLVLHSSVAKKTEGYRYIYPVAEGSEEPPERAFFHEVEADDLAVAQLIRETFPDGVPELPAEERKQMEPGDHCGIFGRDAWWIKKADGTLRIVGNGVAEALELPNEGRFREPYPVALEAVGWFFEKGKQRRIVIGEGIEEIRGNLFTDRSFGEEMETVLLPSTMKVVPFIRGEVRKMTVPPSVRTIHFSDSLFYSCGGHWDPVYYSVGELTLPSEIRMDPDDPLPVCEDIYYWDTIRFYGEQPFPDLQMWYDGCLFDTSLRILYPEAWDQGKPGSYADRILAFVREQHPEQPLFGMAPTGSKPWPKERYEVLRRRIQPYSGLRE